MASNVGRKRSQIWAYFRSGTTFNLNRHLRIVHPAVLPPKIISIAESSEYISPDEPQITFTSSDVSQESSAQLQTLEQPVCRQTTLTSFIRRPLSDKKSQEISFSLVETVVKNYLPFQLVESSYFKNFVSKLNSSYSLPNRKTISNVLIPQLYKMTKEKVKNSVSSGTAFCMTTDTWTSPTNESYLSITVHYINGKMEFKSHVLDCFPFHEKHTAENLAAEIVRVTQEWGINSDIVAVVSDNAANIVAAIRSTGWTHIPCFAHNVNLTVQYGLQEIKDLQMKIKGIVEFFKRSPQASEKLKNMQVQLGSPILHVKQDVVTRWNSTYSMFARILEIKDSLMSSIAINFPSLNNLTNNDIAIISHCCEILKVFKDVTEEMSSEKQITVSKIILLSQALKKWCNKCITREDIPDQAKAPGEKILEALNRRFRSIEENNIFAEATILDPRFKQHGFTDVRCFEKVKQQLISKVSAMPHGNIEQTVARATPEASAGSASDIWLDFDSKVSTIVHNPNPTAGGIVEVNRYLEEP